MLGGEHRDYAPRLRIGIARAGAGWVRYTHARTPGFASTTLTPRSSRVWLLLPTMRRTTD